MKLLHTLDEIEKLCDEATAGPWEYDARGEVFVMMDSKTPDLVIVRAYAIAEDSDANFIAASRELMPKLLKVARAAKELITWEYQPELENALAELDAE